MAAIIQIARCRTYRLSGVALAAVLSIGIGSASAQGLAAVAKASTEARVAGGAESFVREYVATLRSREWNNVARLMHPAALAEFRELMGTLLQSTVPEAAGARAVLTGSDSVSVINAMPDVAFFSAVMSRITTLMPKELSDAIFDSSHSVIGSVAENADVTHVVCRARMSVSGTSATVMEVITVRRTADGWGALLDGSFAAALKELATPPRGSRP